MGIFRRKYRTGIVQHRPGWVSYFWTFVAVLFAAVVFVVAIEAFYFAPWAYPMLGRPTLVGAWVGDFRTPSGVPGAVYLDIHHWVGEQIGQTADHPSGPKLHGEERWCFAHNRREAYSLIGVANRGGDQLWVEHDDLPKPSPGIHFEDLQGSWVGDSLRLYGTAAVFDGKSYLGWTQSTDVRIKTTFLLHPGTIADFEVLCGKIK